MRVTWWEELFVMNEGSLGNNEVSPGSFKTFNWWLDVFWGESGRDRVSQLLASSLLLGKKWYHLMSKGFTLVADNRHVAVQGEKSLQWVHYSGWSWMIIFAGLPVAARVLPLNTLPSTPIRTNNSFRIASIFLRLFVATHAQTSIPVWVKVYNCKQ